MARGIRERVSTTASATARERYIDVYGHFLDATVSEAEYREQGTVLGLNDYLELRRGNSGAFLAFAMIECILSIDLQPEVFNHPALWNLTKIAADMFSIQNDVYSYNKEQACGHSANNIITVIRHGRGVDLQEAMDIAGETFANCGEEFNMWKEKLPSWGPEVDAAVAEYIKWMGACTRGWIDWSLSSPRYFGTSVEAGKRTRRIALATRIS